MRHKVLILAQGSGSRWELEGKQFLGIPKQLAQIDGETLVDRARRLFTEAGCEVVVIAPDDDRFGDRVTLDDPFPTGTEQDKFLGTRHLWAPRRRTIIAWGDCYYTEDAVNKIVRHKSNDLHYFRRTGASKTTGHKWDESFAVSFGPSQQRRVIDLAETVVKSMRQNGYPKRDHIRTHYAAMLGLDLDNVRLLVDTPHQTVIDDWTDDFDRPDEWCRWVGRYYKDKIKIGFCAPWTMGDQWREIARMYAEKHYGQITYGTAEGAMFNRSAARNVAINKTFEQGAEVAFVVDTDTIVSHEQVTAASYLALTTGELVLAYEDYIRLDQQQTKRYMVGVKDEYPKPVKNHASGALAIPRSLWEQVGGFDERFKSWGGEDRAFWLACNALAGRIGSYRVPGDAMHLWHPPSEEKNPSLAEYQDNIELAKRYKAVAGVKSRTGCIPEIEQSELSREAMLAILNEDGGPLNMRPVGRLVDPKEMEVEILCYKNHRGKIIQCLPGSDRALRFERSKNWERVAICR